MADEEDVDAAKANARSAEQNLADTEDQAATDHSSSRDEAQDRANETEE